MDFSNLSRNHIIGYIILIIIVVFVILHMRKHQFIERNGKIGDNYVEGNGTMHYKSRGGEEDSIAVLLDRITWASYSDKYVTHWERLVLPTAIATTIIVLAAYDKIPTPMQTILIIFAIFIAFLIFKSYFQIHADVYNDFYIRRNADLIRDKLGLEENPAPDPVTDYVPSRVELR